MTTYYVRPVNGNDANAGSSYAAAWKTTAKALTTALAAGDEVRLCAEATEQVTASIVPSRVGGIGNFIKMRGYDASGTTPATYTIQAVATWGGGPLVSVPAATSYFHWKDVVFDANSLATYAFANTVANTLSLVFVDCEFKNGTSGGFICGNTAALGQWHLVNCNIHSNAGPGASTNSTSGIFSLVGCRIHNNTGDGVYVGDNQVPILGCLIYDNGGAGINVDLNAADNTPIFGNTIYNNTGNGITVSTNAEACLIVNNCLSDNGGYGVGNASAEESMFDYNHFYNNTSGTYQTTPKDGDHTASGDPLFTAPGSADFTPAYNSPLAGAGILGSTIGVVTPASGGGSGPTVYIV